MKPLRILNNVRLCILKAQNIIGAIEHQQILHTFEQGKASHLHLQQEYDPGRTLEWTPHTMQTTDRYISSLYFLLLMYIIQSFTAEFMYSIYNIYKKNTTIYNIYII